MMTIKEFASLCNCNAQTLRYYDKIGLLKPVQVDRWSGYRHYTESQAIDFVKIKNLQLADFTIEEIKRLLTLSDQQVYEAFCVKIAEQEQKLARIREIQQSYLSEINTMKKLIEKICSCLLENAKDLDGLRELGLTPADAPRLVEAIRQNILYKEHQGKSGPETVELVVNDEVYTGEAAVENLLTMLEQKELPRTGETKKRTAAEDDGD